MLFGKVQSNQLFGYLAASILCIVSTSSANASCIRQSLMKHDYCGPESSKVAYLVPERVVGDFKGACAGHDACYAFGGEKVVAMMENRFQQSMLGASQEQKGLFREEMRRIKKSCDRQFNSDMRGACGRVVITGKPKCLTAATGYYFAVSKLADRAFDQALDEAFTCRTR